MIMMYKGILPLFVFILRSDLACNIALDATATVALEENGRREIDIKRYAKVEKVSPFYLRILVYFC
jgi:T-complex protein 1 subunit gamma